jgi:hypothetical protein
VLEETIVYDLGEVRIDSGPTIVAQRTPDPSPTKISPPRAATTRRESGPAAFAPCVQTPAGSVIPGSLSRFITGTGHQARRQWIAGLFFLSTLGFLATFGWAMLETLDRVTATLTVLGRPRVLGIWAVALTYVCLAVVYLWNVVSSGSTDRIESPHPVVAGAASALLPGWGQVLNGNQRRAAVFLGSLWFVGSSWILAAPQTAGVLESMGMYLPAALNVFSSTAVRWTLPAVIWTLAIYDAASSASNGR